MVMPTTVERVILEGVNFGEFVDFFTIRQN